MFSLVKMSRLGNILIAVITLAVGVFISHANFHEGEVLADAFAFAFAIAFGNILNDILDIETDRVNQPSRPLPSGKVSMKTAKFATVFGAVLTLAAVCIPGAPFLLHFAFYAALLTVLFFYDKFLKQIPLIKNITVAFLCTTPFIRVLFYENASPYPLYTALVFAFLFTLSREIFKDLEDADGDLKAGIATFPLIAGEAKAKTFALLILIFGLISLPIPVLFLWMPQPFLYTVAALTPVVFFIFRFAQKKNFRMAQKFTKFAMILGLGALVITNY